jgi:aspartate aminotransferase
VSGTISSRSPTPVRGRGLCDETARRNWFGAALTDKGGRSLRPHETRSRVGDRPAVPSSIASSMPVSRIREVMELAWGDPEAIHLEVGEPDFPTSEHVVEAAYEAARAGRTRYAPNAGLPELREALADKVTRRNGYEAHLDQVVVTQGGIQALYLVLLALLEPGDEVLLPDPAWPNFRMIAHLLGAHVLSYPLVAEGDFLPRLEDLERLVTPRTRAILVNSPSNPLGTVLPRELVEALLAFARRQGLWFISDEVYDEVVFDDIFVSAASIADPSDRLVSVYSFSKVYAMTGWRVGYLVAPPDMAKLLTGMQEPIISCVNTPAQMAALAAVTGPQDVVGKMREAYRTRRDELLEILDRGGLPSSQPSGAFYVWTDVSEAGVPSMDFARSLIEREHVAVAPGGAFGELGEGYVRLSLASSREDLLDGASRLVRFVDLLGRPRR